MEPTGKHRQLMSAHSDAQRSDALKTKQKMTATSQPSALSPQPLKRGWINTYYRYYKGKKLGPYYVRRWKHNGKTHKEYIKPKDLETVRSQCEAYRERRMRQLICAMECKALIDNHKFCHFMMIRCDKNLPIRPEWAAHIERIHQHGPFVPGRPRLRRKRVFMAPCVHKEFANYLKNLGKVVLQQTSAPRPTTNDQRGRE